MKETSMNSEVNTVDENNKVVQNVQKESMNDKSVNNEKADTSNDERNRVISSNDNEIGEASEICEPLIVLASEKSNYDIYSFASSEDLSDVDFCIPKKGNVRKSSILYCKSAKTGKLLPAKVAGNITYLYISVKYKYCICKWKA